MKSKIFLFLLLVVSLLFFFSCEKEFDFEKEQYKKVIYLLSDENFVSPQPHSLNEDETVGHLTIYAGGTNPIERNVVVTLQEHDSLFNAYNKSNFDIDTAKFAQLLSSDRYTIPSYSIEMIKGSQDPYVLFPVKVRTAGLSPDSTYFINLRIQEVSEYEFNPKKKDVLYQAMIENDYTSTYKNNLYAMKRARIVEEGAVDSVRFNFAVKLYPLSYNTIRMNAGKLHINPDSLSHINRNSMVLTVNEDKSVDFSPYKSDQLEVEKIDSPNSNYYAIQEDKQVMYKVFHLFYKYRRANSTDHWQVVNQIIRMEIVEER